jgi:hypothetical protein
MIERIKDGFHVILQAVPIPDRDGHCKIVLRPPKRMQDNETEQAAGLARQRQETVRQSNDRRHAAISGGWSAVSPTLLPDGMD